MFLFEPTRCVLVAVTLVTVAGCWNQPAPNEDLRARSEPGSSAERSFLAAMEADESHAESHFQLGNLYSASDPQRAIHHYRAAVNSRPDFLDAQYNLGLTLVQANDLTAARQHFAEMDAIEPGHAAANYQLGNIAIRMQQFDAAVARFERAIETDPQHADAHLNLGAILFAQDRLTEAVPHLQFVVQLQPQDAQVRSNLGAALLQQCEVAAAIEQLELAIELAADYSSPKLLLAEALLQRKEQGDLERARSLAREVVAAQDAKSAEGCLVLARCLLVDGHREAARTAANRGVELARALSNDAVANRCQHLLQQLDFTPAAGPSP